MARTNTIVKRKRSGRRQSQGDSVSKFAGDAYSLGTRALRGLNEIRKLINIEYKVLDKIQTSTTFSTSGGILALSQIAQGLDFNNRVGDSIKIQRIIFTGRINVNAATTTTTVRVLLVRDLQGFGTRPLVSDVLQTVGTASAPLSPMNFLNRDRFSVLFDELMTLSPSTNYSAPVSYDVPHAGHIKYLGSTAADASDGNGTLYWITLSDEATNLPSYSLCSRIIFTDD